MSKEKKTLVIMAAGIGSRFGGGIKQLEPVGPNGEIIVDYSIYDAVEAGFNKVVFVIRKDLEKDFKEVIGNRIEEKIEVAYAYQEILDIPSPYREDFRDRKKPWGTGQAILACKDIVDEPFVVINADDYYGKDAYKKAYEYLTKGDGQCCRCAKGEDVEAKSGESLADGSIQSHPRVDEVESAKYSNKPLLETAMVSFVLKNTLSDHGTVTRGVCKRNSEGYLESIVETSNIAKRGEKAVVLEGDTEVPISAETLVSMNMWCFFPDFFSHLEKGFEGFLSELAGREEAYLKAEYLLPTIVGEGLKKGELTVKVLQSEDSWFGVTYKEDKEIVVAEIGKLVEKGLYP